MHVPASFTKNMDLGQERALWEEQLVQVQCSLTPAFQVGTIPLTSGTDNFSHALCSISPKIQLKNKPHTHLHKKHSQGQLLNADI